MQHDGRTLFKNITIPNKNIKKILTDFDNFVLNKESNEFIQNSKEIDSSDEDEDISTTDLVDIEEKYNYISDEKISGGFDISALEGQQFIWFGFLKHIHQ